MPRLRWSENRKYTYGVDRGVLYSKKRGAQVWNGLTRVDLSETPEIMREQAFEGQAAVREYRATTLQVSVECLTYPSFLEKTMPYLATDAQHVRKGLGGDPRDRYALSFRTKTDNGYVIHIVTNCAFEDSSLTFNTSSDDPDLEVFGFNAGTTKEKLENFSPTSHIYVVVPTLSYWKVDALEDFLYGNESNDPQYPVLDPLLKLIESMKLLTIIDHGDGSWTAIGPDDMVKPLANQSFEITANSAVYISSNTYQISDE